MSENPNDPKQPDDVTKLEKPDNVRVLHLDLSKESDQQLLEDLKKLLQADSLPFAVTCETPDEPSKTSRSLQLHINTEGP